MAKQAKEESMGVKILFAGDVSIQSSCQSLSIEPNLQTKIQKYNHRCCNFEGPVCSNPSSTKDKIGPSVRQHSDSLSVLDNLGFNLYSLSNNHIMDYAELGLTETMNALQNKGHKSFGAGESRVDALSPCIVEEDGVRVGLIALAENSFGALHGNSEHGHSWIFDPLLDSILNETKKNTDYVIAVCHAGAERLNVPLPEWRLEYKKLIDKGFDGVVAHHPHVIQRWEEYRGKMIFYSLGNFLWKRPHWHSLGEGDTVLLGLSFGKQSMSFEVIPVRVEKDSIEINSTKEYNKYVDSCVEILSENKIPEYELIVSDFCENLYAGAFKDYYYNAIGLQNPKSLKAYAYGLAKYFLKLTQMNDLFVYHNIAVETNNWICQRAIRKRNRV